MQVLQSISRFATPWLPQKLIGSKREATASIREAPHAYIHSELPRTTNIIEIDCRGLEFVEFKADVRISDRILYRDIDDSQGEWKARAIETNTTFTSIDLSEGDWYDYDEKAGGEVSIKEMQWTIRRA